MTDPGHPKMAETAEAELTSPWWAAVCDYRQVNRSDHCPFTTISPVDTMLTSPPTIVARTRDLQPVALVLLSAALFGSLGVLAQLAYGTGVSVLGLLVGRFTVAGAVLWLIVLVLRRPLPSRRGLLTAVALGAGYSSMALSFAASLKHIEADLADLLLFAYPVLVSLGAAVLARERFSPRRAVVIAVALSSSVIGTSAFMAGVSAPRERASSRAPSPP
jgi:EamA-like transporter family